jgi:hypothetical protein
MPLYILGDGYKMTTNVELLCILVILSLMNLLVSLIINYRKCRQELHNIHALEHIESKFHYHKKK